MEAVLSPREKHKEKYKELVKRTKDRFKLLLQL